MKAIRFTSDFTQRNGTGNPDGPFYKTGQVISFADDVAANWIRIGVAVEATKVEAAASKPAPAPNLIGDGDGLDKMKATDLVAIAESEKIDLGAATKKSEIVEIIRTARLEKATAPTPKE